ncbi:MAG: hypothetical protein KGI98_07760 [Euryarchaeota archaeon]|nr:hypothetical protein [Euryarchaeota archaeon]
MLVGVWAAVLLMLLPSGASPHAALSSSPPGEPTEVVGTREVASSLASVGTTWTQLCPSCGPSPRGDSAETYDPALGYTLLFGGGDASSVRLGDTWKFENGNWTLLHPVTSPTARQGAEMVYDPTDHEVVLFGGLDNSRNVLNDTWVFVGGNWTALSTPHAPAPRYDTAMVWDASDGYVLLFGGCQVGCASTFGDTWKFLGGGWTQLTPTTSPSTRGWVPMTFDTADGDVVIFGGCAPSYVSLADTWTYHAGLWTQIYPSARPAARCGGLNMVFDASLGYAMMFGGSDNGTILLDTWSWASGAWTQLSPAVSPAGGPLLADDPAQAGVMGFGGTIGCNNCVDNNTWLYHDTVPTPLGISSFSASSSGVALGQSVTFSVVAKGGTPPYTFAYAGLPKGCSSANTALLSCAPAAPGTSTTRVYVNDTASGTVSATTTLDVYAPIFRNWTEICATCGPLPRGDDPIAYDPIDGYTLLFAGGTSVSNLYNDTWMFRNGLWNQLHPSRAPVPMQGPDLVWDPVDHEFVLFGGLDTGRVTHNETWVFSPTTLDWTELSTPHAPVPRYDGSMVWDTSDGYALLFGGCLVTCKPTLGDTWTFVGGTWTELSPATAPSSRGWAPMSYDSADNEVVLFGGAAPNYVPLGDTWTFHAGSWTQIFPALSPSPRFNGIQGFNDDPAVGYAVMYGGGNDTTSFPQTWAFRGGSWTPFTTAVSPGLNGDMGSVYDASAGGMIIFGGGSPIDNATWIFGPWVAPLGIQQFVASPAVIPLGGSTTLTVQAVGGTAPYHYAYSGLPAGCTSTNVASLPCSPSAVGTYSVDVWVNDSASGKVSSTTSFTVYQPIFHNWTEICAACGPSPRGDAPLAYDPVDGYTLLFGGGSGPSYGPRLNDTWMFHNGVWTQLHPAHTPVGLQGADLVWDPTDHEFVLFGGLDGNRITHNETWAFSPVTQDWTELSTPHAPATRYDGSMVWDAADGYVLLFGGCYVTCKSVLGDTWKFLGGTWTELTPASVPSARGWAPLTYDSADSEVVLFGGAAPNYAALGDTWLFKGGTWTEIFPSTSPAARWNGLQGFSDDPALGYAVMYGGTTGAVSLSDSWAFKAGTWTQVTTATNAGTNGDMGMTYDASAGGVIMFGNGQPGTIDNSTWIYGPWSPPPLSVSLTAAPSPTDSGSPVDLTATSSGGAGSISYAFAFGDGASPPGWAQR